MFVIHKEQDWVDHLGLKARVEANEISLDPSLWVDRLIQMFK